MSEFESLGQYHDFWGHILLSAPDNFHRFDSEVVDQADELRKEFDVLRRNLYLAKKKIGDDRLYRIAQELIEISYEAYRAGDGKTGAHSLQECEGLIWKSRSSRVKYGVEAERRAFGEVVIYAEVRVSPYPYEGGVGDLGKDQEVLLELSRKHVENYLSAWRDFSYFAWVMELDGTIKRISPEPKDDDVLVLRPLQKSISACFRCAKVLAQSGKIRACVVMEIVGPQGDGIVCYDLEQKGYPRISARQLFSLQKGPSHVFEGMRYHLDDPEIFVAEQ